MTFAEFTSVDFGVADGVGYVYVLCWLSGEDRVPFYVGQTQSIWGRLNDYYWADFQAATDFRVGEAVKYLNGLGFRTSAAYRKSIDRRAEEAALIRELKREGRQLLNDCGAYDYKTTLPVDERVKVRAFVEDLLATWTSERTARGHSKD